MMQTFEEKYGRAGGWDEHWGIYKFYEITKSIEYINNFSSRKVLFARVFRSGSSQDEPGPSSGFNSVAIRILKDGTGSR